MGYRDEHEALRQRVRVLEEERDALVEQRDVARTEARLARRPRGHGWTGAVWGTPIGLTLGFVLGISGSAELTGATLCGILGFLPLVLGAYWWFDWRNEVGASRRSPDAPKLRVAERPAEGSTEDRAAAEEDAIEAAAAARVARRARG